MKYFKSLKCTKCGLEYSPSTVAGYCNKCRSPLTVVYDYSKLREVVSKELFEKRTDGIWKYIELLPCSKENAVTLGEGDTALIKCSKLSRKLGAKNLYIKDETKNPTGSFLDRGSSVLITRLLEAGFKGVYGVFKGNLGASLSAYSAKAGLKCIAFISGKIEASKLYQMIAYGATIYSLNKFKELVLGDDYFFADNADPFLVEGEKTIGFELFENMGFQLPDFIIVPMGSGGLISAIWKSLKELYYVGLIDQIDCKLIGVQAEYCSPIVDMFYSNKEGKDYRDTIAIDLAFEKPSRGAEAVKALKESRGYAFKVSDEEMLSASIELARNEGIFAEPAAASTIACVKKMLDTGILDPSDTVVCIITGSGLKDPLAALKELEKNMALEKFIKHKVKVKPRLGVGSTKILILRILSKESLHGYEIWRKLKEAGRSTSIPAVYQHLKELERMKLISRDKTEVVGGKVRTYYRITSKGLEFLKALS